MRVKIYFFLYALLIFTICGSLLYAGTTGKIAGKVTDASNNEPLVGANTILSSISLPVTIHCVFNTWGTRQL
jgi:hypothetical protein